MGPGGSGCERKSVSPPLPVRFLPLTYSTLGSTCCFRRDRAQCLLPLVSALEEALWAGSRAAELAGVEGTMRGWVAGIPVGRVGSMKQK